MLYQWQGLHVHKVVRAEQVHKFNNQNKGQQLHACMAGVNYTGMQKSKYSGTSLLRTPK